MKLSTSTVYVTLSQFNSALTVECISVPSMLTFDPHSYSFDLTFGKNGYRVRGTAYMYIMYV